MWWTPEGTRTLRGAESALFRAALGRLVDQILDAGDQTGRFRIILFDQQTQARKLAWLAALGECLLRKEVPAPPRTVQLEVALLTVYEEIRAAVAEEIDQPKIGSDLPTWRELILRVYAEIAPEEVDELPPADDADIDDWDLFLDSLRARVLWDDEYEDAHLSLNAPPNGTDRLKQNVNTSDDTEPDEHEMNAILKRLRELIQLDRDRPPEKPPAQSGPASDPPSQVKPQASHFSPPDKPSPAVQPKRGAWGDTAMIWVRASCPSRDVQRDFARLLDEVAAKGLNCSFTVGRRLTHSGRDYLIHCYQGEVFVFELTADQAGRLGVEGNGLVRNVEVPHPRPAPLDPPLVHLDRIEVGDKGRMAATEPITGRCTYRLAAGPDAVWNVKGTFALRLEYWRHRQSIGSWHYLNGPPLAPTGELTFSFSPINKPGESEARRFCGPLAVFVQLWLVADPRRPEQRRPVSDLCAALIDVR